MPLYDPLISFLQKNGECDQELALTYLNGYKHRENAYGQLNRLVRQGILYRRYENKKPIIGLCVVARTFDKPHPKSIPTKPTLEECAVFYRYFIRYGAQHFSSPGRTNFMAIMRAWLREIDDLIQFPIMLQDLLTRNISQQEFRELEKGLQEAGWYAEDYDAADRIDIIIDVLKQDQNIENFLGYPDEQWKRLHDLDGLGRINNTAEQGQACIEPKPGTPNRLSWKQQLYEHYGDEENWPKNQSEIYTKFQQQRDEEHR